MEIIVRIILALIVMAILFFFVCVIISAIKYIYEEANHTIKNLKRSTREFMWDVEWKWNHR